MSYLPRLKSIDDTMKTRASHKKIAPSWGELGWILLQAMNRGVVHNVVGHALRLSPKRSSNKRMELSVDLAVLETGSCTNH